MSKTNDTSRLATLEDHYTLADSELDVVTGGSEFVITKLMDVSYPASVGGDGGGGAGPAIGAWNQLLKDYGYR